MKQSSIVSFFKNANSERILKSGNTSTNVTPDVNSDLNVNKEFLATMEIISAEAMKNISAANDLGDKDDNPKQPKDINFPVSKFGSKNLSFCINWYSRFHWLEYSRQKDAAFCFICRHFSSEGYKNNAFVLSGFKYWKGAIIKFNKHAQSTTHQSAIISWQCYQKSKKNGSVCIQLSSLHKKTIEENRLYLNRIITFIKYLACQGLAFRGHDETNISKNRGNFLELVRCFEKIDPEFAAKLNKMPENTNYLSRAIQNEIISIIATEIKKQIVAEVKNSGMYAILADETRDCSRKEQMSICVRYVNSDFIICEEFLGYKHVNELDASSLSNSLI